MKKIIVLNKKEGETPLEALESFRAKNKKYKDVKMTYAGRLDPLVSGLLLVLAGNTVKEKEKYLKLSKEYNFDVLFGFATDTYDILGKVTSANLPLAKGEARRGSELKNLIKKNLKFFIGKFQQQYPMYSSKTVDGKPLFTYARRGEPVISPKHEVSVTSLKFLKLRKISAKELLENIEKRIKKVKGDFRQEEILKIWRKNLSVKHRVFDAGFFVASFHIKCGSGTYVRSVANDLGQRFGMSSLALTIKRTKIGNWGKA